MIIKAIFESRDGLTGVEYFHGERPKDYILKPLRADIVPVYSSDFSNGADELEIPSEPLRIREYKLYKYEQVEENLIIAEYLES